MPFLILCTYMAAQPTGDLRSASSGIAQTPLQHNVYLMLYPESRLQNALNSHPELAARVFEGLQRVTPDQFISEGRVYGGGLHKVEPKELAQIPARAVLESIGGCVRLERQERLFA